MGVHSFRGIDEDGCLLAECDDSCCKYGADVDKESYKLIYENKEVIEKKIGFSIDKCFKKRWLDDTHYLGGNAIETRVGSTGFCMFHDAKGKGCVLYKLVHEKNLSRRLIPSICRLYPLTWENGELIVTDDVYPSCNCMKKDKFAKSIFATQKKEIDDIFHFKGKAKRKAQSTLLRK